MMLDTTKPEHGNTAWAGDMTADLLRMYADGLSMSVMAGEINAKYGTSFSRNAVIGKLHRMGLRRGRAVPPLVRKPRKPRGPYKRVPWAVPVETPRQANTEPARAPAPDPRFACTILDLTNETCRFPVSEDSPFIFCGTPGADLTGHMPYCQAHMRIAHG